MSFERRRSSGKASIYERRIALTEIAGNSELHLVTVTVTVLVAAAWGVTTTCSAAAIGLSIQTARCKKEKKILP